MFLSFTFDPTTTQHRPTRKGTKRRCYGQINSLKMISKEDREALKKRVDGKAADYVTAAEIYERITGRSIASRYLYKFITGERAVHGRKPGSHNPVHIYEALIEAVEKREKTEAEMATRANELRQRLAA